jgi:hypothetical protein
MKTYYVRSGYCLEVVEPFSTIEVAILRLHQRIAEWRPGTWAVYPDITTNEAEETYEDGERVCWDGLTAAERAQIDEAELEQVRR